MWVGVNAGLIVLSVFAGYAAMSPSSLAHSNPDAVFLTSVAVLTTVVSVWGFLYGLKSSGESTARRPSLRRSPIAGIGPTSFWRDPLQPIFVATLSAVASLFGAALRLPRAGPKGIWIVGMDACFLLGLLIGQTIIYLALADRIAASEK